MAGDKERDETVVGEGESVLTVLLEEVHGERLNEH